jgi:hypothetical protein
VIPTLWGAVFGTGVTATVLYWGNKQTVLPCIGLAIAAIAGLLTYFEVKA